MFDDAYDVLISSAVLASLFLRIVPCSHLGRPTSRVEQTILPNGPPRDQPTELRLWGSGMIL